MNFNFVNTKLNQFHTDAFDNFFRFHCLRRFLQEKRFVSNWIMAHKPTNFFNKNQIKESPNYNWPNKVVMLKWICLPNQMLHSHSVVLRRTQDFFSERLLHFTLSNTIILIEWKIDYVVLIGGELAQFLPQHQKNKINLFVIVALVFFSWELPWDDESDIQNINDEDSASAVQKLSDTHTHTINSRYVCT